METAEFEYGLLLGSIGPSYIVYADNDPGSAGQRRKQPQTADNVIVVTGDEVLIGDGDYSIDT